jgi:hypothetical protein
MIRRTSSVGPWQPSHPTTRRCRRAPYWHWQLGLACPVMLGSVASTSTRDEQASRRAQPETVASRDVLGQAPRWFDRNKAPMLVIAASPLAAVVPAIPALSRSDGPATLERRLRAIRHKRAASRVANATNLLAWIAGLGVLMIVVAGGLLSLR